MEFLKNAKALRLRSHLGKYLVADEDEETVRQSRNGSSQRARWTVEYITGVSHLIRLKSCHGRYLTASDESFLLGMTGKKVVLDLNLKPLAAAEWEPLKEGSLVKFRAKASGKFLRANGGTPPWRNSVTHDVPDRTATQDWILWNLEVVDIILSSCSSPTTTANMDSNYLSPASSFSSSSVAPDEESIGSTTTRIDSRHQDDPSIQSSSSISRLSSPVSSWLKNDNEVGAAASPTRRKSRLSSIFSRGSGSGSFSSNFSGEEEGSASNNSSRSQRATMSRLGYQSGMELFERAKSVRLQSKQGKFLVAEEDEETVRQSRDGSSRRARWLVECVDVAGVIEEGKGKGNELQLIRLRSVYGKYLTASEEALGFGMSGKKVVQGNKRIDSSTEWEPIKDGASSVKLMSKDGTFLRANGGTPPWRNAVTHDIPNRTATQDSVLWGVDIIDIIITSEEEEKEEEEDAHNKEEDDEEDEDEDAQNKDEEEEEDSASDSGTHIKTRSKQTYHAGMEYFRQAKTVRLRSHHDKFLLADDDKETVCQDRYGTSKAAKWIVELVDGCDTVIRLKSCYGRYLTAADDQYLLGVTGRKVLQTLPSKLDSKVEWEPIRDGFQVRLKTRYGNYLRANGGLPPWRNSITHDVPHRHAGWIMWQVDIVEVRPQFPATLPATPRSSKILDSEDEEDEEEDLGSSAFRLRSDSLAARQEVGGGGRMIYYYLGNQNGDRDERVGESSYKFKGHSMEQLKKELEKETGVEDAILCSRNPSNGKLYPLRLALPPNNATMRVILVSATSRVARDFVADAS